ncbi:hypothetical protein LTR65_006509 [Meristemomyces frigidus]
MLRPSPAARRFYRAFYQWTLLAAPTPAARVGGGNVCHRAFTTSKPLRQDDAHGNTSLLRIHKHVHTYHRRHPTPVDGVEEHNPARTPQNTPIRSTSQSTPIRSTSQSSPIPRTTQLPVGDHQGPYKTWRAQAAQNSVERPFSALAAWDQVIRFKSDNLVTLELAVPQDIIAEKKAFYGGRLERMAARTGARVELGSVPVQQDDGGEAALYSVLISGTFEEAGKALSTLTHRRQTKTTSPAAEGKAEHSQPRAHELAQAESGQLPAAKPSSRASIDAWHNMPVHSHIARSSDTIAPWSFIIRARTSDGNEGTIEFVLPEIAWAQWLYGGGSTALVARKTGANVEVAQSSSSRNWTGARDAHSGGPMRSILLSGTPKRIRHALAMLEAPPSGAGEREADAAPSPSTPPGAHASPPTTGHNPGAAEPVTRRLTIPSWLQVYMGGAYGKHIQRIKRLSGIEQLTFAPHPDDARSILCATSGTPEACAHAAETIWALMRFAEQHHHPKSLHYDGASKAFSVTQPEPNVVAKFVFPGATDSRRGRIARYVLGSKGDQLQGIRLKTLCRISKQADKEGVASEGGVWTIVGPKDGVDVALREMQAVVDRKFERAGTPSEAIVVVERGALDEHPTLVRPELEQGGAGVGSESVLSGRPSAEASQHPMQVRPELEQGGAGAGSESIPPGRPPQEASQQPTAGIVDARHAGNAIDAPEVVNQSASTAQLSDNLRAVLRPLTHPVVLITSRMKRRKGTKASPGSQDDDVYLEDCRGVTVSSFSAVTLHPKPIISFNLKVPSRTWAAMLSSESVCVHILAATPAAAALTHAFTQAHEQAHRPFKVARRLGGVVMANAMGTRPPKIYHAEAVLARLFARVLVQKCVEVGDHVVVLAEVRAVAVTGEQGEGSREAALARLGGEEAVGLNYARRAYRGLGGAIEVLEVPEEDLDEAGIVQAVDEEGTGDETHLAEEDDADVFAPEEMQQDASQRAGLAQSAEDVEFDYFRAIQAEEGTGGHEEEDGAAARPAASTTTGAKRSAAVEQEEDDYDLGLGAQEGVVEQQKRAITAPRRPNDDAKQALRDEVRDVLDFARSTPRSVLSTLGERSSRHNRPTVQTAQAWHLGQVRSYATTTSTGGGQLDDTAALAAGDAQRMAAARRQVTDPAMLSQTIDDFLGQSHGWVPPKRMRALLNARRAAARAARQLEQALSSGATLAEEDSLRLEHTIGVNERRVAKVLGLRAAEDLRRVLDEGRVDVRTARWMEEAVEKGMAVMVEEAKRARAMYDEGRIDEAQFGLVREQLEREHGVLNVEAMRLREWGEDEEGEGGLQ